MKEDRQAFGVMLREAERGGVNPEEAFWYPVTTVPLSLAFPDSNLRQNPQHHFCNYLIVVSKTCESTSPNETLWIIDTISVVRAIKVIKE